MKKLFTKGRIIFLIIALVLSALAIHPTFSDDGVAIRNVEKNSSAALAGINNPSAGSSPTSREIIISINKMPVNTESDYNNIVENFEAEEDLVIKTNKGSYFLTVKPIYELTEDGFKTVTESFFNETSNETINLTKQVPNIKKTIIGSEDIGLTIYPRPTNNIRKGLDLEGGTRVLLQPEEPVSNDEMSLILDNIRERRISVSTL